MPLPPECSSSTFLLSVFLSVVLGFLWIFPWTVLALFVQNAMYPVTMHSDFVLWASSKWLSCCKVGIRHFTWYTTKRPADTDSNFSSNGTYSWASFRISCNSLYVSVFLFTFLAREHFFICLMVIHDHARRCTSDVSFGSCKIDISPVSILNIYGENITGSVLSSRLGFFKMTDLLWMYLGKDLNRSALIPSGEWQNIWLQPSEWTKHWRVPNLSL